MNYKKLELKLRKLIEERLSEGWNLAPGGIFVDETNAQCCAVGVSVAGKINPNFCNSLEEARRALGISEDDALSVSDGFEGYAARPRPAQKRMHAIGANIRRVYCDDNGEVE